MILSIAASAGEVVEFPEWTIHNMQDMNPTICANAEINTTGQLTDLRDGKQYWVSKLADGNCWMTQNLDYDGGGTRVTGTSGENGGPGTEWKHDSDVAQYWDPGNKIPSGGGLIDAPANVDTHLLVGNYYTWLAATKNTGADTEANQDASASICPDNWKLPVHTGDGSLASLSEGLTPAQFINAPYYFVYGAKVSGGILRETFYGELWTSTRRNDGTSIFAYNFSYDRGEFRPTPLLDDGFAGYGYNIRCLAN